MFGELAQGNAAIQEGRDAKLELIKAIKTYEIEYLEEEKMPKFKVKMLGDDGDFYLEEGGSYDPQLFDTEEEAEEAALEACSNCRLGMEILNMSNPGDYPYEDDMDIDYEIIEVDD